MLMKHTVPLLGVPIGVSICGLILIHQINLFVLKEHEKTDTIISLTTSFGSPKITSLLINKSTSTILNAALRSMLA